MESAILVRHAESRFSVRDAMSGDPRSCAGLTAAGREQARELGRLLAAEPVHLCVTTEFARTRETADIALAGRDVPRIVVAELNDIRAGTFEGQSLEEYRSWAWSAGPAEACPGGGESRAEAAARFARGFRAVLGRAEEAVLVIAHGLPIRYVLDAAGGRDPACRVTRVEYVRPARLAAADLERAVERLEAWCERPVFA
jgi:alpha-ribazole phosphatase